MSEKDPVNWKNVRFNAVGCLKYAAAFATVGAATVEAGSLIESGKLNLPFGIIAGLGGMLWGALIYADTFNLENMRTPKK